MRITILLSFSLYVLVGSFGHLSGQGSIQESYAITYLDVADGLASNYVSSIISDYRGIKWLATEGGLNTYDGKNFKTYTPRTVNDGLLSENVETLCPSRDGQFWLATKNGGISKYDPKLDQFTNYNEVLGALMDVNFWAVSLAEDKHGRLWIGTSRHGIIVLDPEKNEVVMRRHPDTHVREVISDRYGNIWYGAVEEVFYYNAAEDNFVSFPTSRQIHRLVEDTLGQRIWLGTNRLLANIDLTTHKMHELELIEQISPGFNIESLNVDHHGRLWIGTWGGGLFVRKVTGEIEEIPISRTYEGPLNTSLRSIIDIHIDNQDLVWLGTAYGGVVKLSPRGGFSYLGNQPNRKTGLLDNNVRCIATGQDGTIWLGTRAGGLHEWKHGSQPEVREDFKMSKIQAVVVTEDNRPITGGLEGVFSQDANGKIVRLAGGAVYIAVLHREKGGGLWLGSQRDGVAYLPDAQSPLPPIGFPDFKEKMASLRIRSFAEGAESVWIGSYAGVHRFDLDSRELFPPEMNGGDHLASLICHDLLVRSRELWIATPAGLERMKITDDGHLIAVKTFTAAEGLPDDFVTAVNIDHNGFIWGSTSRGLFRLDPQTGYILSFGVSDGVTAGQFNIDATAIDKEGVLYFGGTNGLIYFDPSAISTDRPAPVLVLTSLDIDGKRIKVGEEIAGKTPLSRVISDIEELDLSYQHSSFSLAYATTDYLGTETVTSQYRLRGLSEEWIDVPEFGSLTFTGLRSGTYDLELRGSRDRMNWSDPVVLGLRIPPPPWRSNFAYLLYVLLIGLILYLVRRNEMRRQELTTRTELAELAEQNERELTEAKLKFFTNISHELRTPLTLILSPLTDLLGDRRLVAHTHDVITGVHRSASRLLNLVNQLLDFRKSESGQLQLETAPGDFEAFAREIYRSFQPLADSRKLNYHFISKGTFNDFYYDRDKLEIVICNLLSNAFKFCKKEVVFTLSPDREGLCFSVADDGPGIPKEDRKKVFDRFVQLHHDDIALPISSGIGLAFSKRIIELHHGRISLADGPKGGAVFEVYLPSGRAHFGDEEVLSDFKGHDDQRHYAGDMAPPVVMVAAEHQPTLLLVDDNTEILAYLKGQLNGTYRVITAGDGEAALALARKQIPDIVVSDVMMPKMDGIELCKHLKTTVATSHIPVLLLTARTSTVFQVSGLSEGADDYITKPFSSDVLRARLGSLLNNREKLRKYYRNQLRFEPGELPVEADPEEEFLRKLTTLILERFDEDNLSGDILAKELFMSRSTLFRKTKSLTGLSISAFIRGVRLRRAAERLLSEPQTPIGQIAYEVGFKDAKYFRKSFQQEFDELPSIYRSTRQNGNASSG
ncbi:two-component regulator propeller domain-containing protein [Neolewinella persica]|uniref:two-component regulator propeller domain-containing protein n=1 Tax=Neolewinella persica TaxID=70998 RepID=UPI0003A16FC2|nr:two-component regulator propeller domain-containing protein [Neolewinella persica]